MKKKIVNQIEVFILEVRGRRPFYARSDRRGSVPRRTLVLLVLLGILAQPRSPLMSRSLM